MEQMMNVWNGMPSPFSCDALHVCSEGLTTDGLRDLFTGSSSFAQLRISNGVIADKITVTQRAANITEELWRALAPKIITMKCHWFFDHAMQEELEQYSSPYQWSSAPFESRHCQLQVKIRPSTTTSSSVAINRFPVEVQVNVAVYIPKNSEITEL
ncbi:hypothetical protein Q1695_003139 [Nippostrongylus brasiliensis]|nr:hypothetical protein Q1695_003139 [Nippostrongylus brasiliensis]